MSTKGFTLNPCTPVWVRNGIEHFKNDIIFASVEVENESHSHKENSMFNVLLSIFACGTEIMEDTAKQHNNPYFNGTEIQILDIYCSALQVDRAQSICLMPNRDGEYQFCHNVAAEHGWSNITNSDDLFAFNDYIQSMVSGLELSTSEPNSKIESCISDNRLSFFDIDDDQINFFSDSTFHGSEYSGYGLWSGHAYLTIDNPNCERSITELGWQMVEESFYGEPYQFYGETPVFKLVHKNTLTFEAIGF